MKTKIKPRPAHQPEQQKQKRLQLIGTIAALITLYTLGSYTLLGFFLPD